MFYHNGLTLPFLLKHFELAMLNLKWTIDTNYMYGFFWMAEEKSLITWINTKATKIQELSEFQRIKELKKNYRTEDINRELQLKLSTKQEIGE